MAQLAVLTGKRQYRVTSSVVEDFAAGHDASDILRELVQNEYDAGGSHLIVEFGAEAVTIGGTGVPIDRAGWRRLSMMMGTGDVAGLDDHVDAKASGIGSKNHGIRSLFRYGDEIEIFSGGRATSLHIYDGALVEPVEDADSRGAPGVRIRVPYREKMIRRLPPFDVEREAQDLEGLAAHLAPTLLKLAHEDGTGIRRVDVKSDRLDESVTWRQSAKVSHSNARGVTALDRTIRCQGSGEILRAHAGGTITEIEFQRTLDARDQDAPGGIPGYFRGRRGRVRIGVSVRLDRGRLSRGHPGLFFYPIGTPTALTGSAISVSAPFAMDGDRKHLIPSVNSDWNEWLLEEAARLCVEVLIVDLVPRFGADSYEAVGSTLAASEPAFNDAVERQMKATSCWLSRATKAGRPVLREIDQIYVARTPELASVLDEDEVLHARVLDLPTAFALAQSLGMREFTAASAVRLRCFGNDESDMRTTLDHTTGVSLTYTDFPKPLLDTEMQRNYSLIFDRHRRELSRESLEDLRSSPTTLSVAGTLEPASSLSRADPRLEDLPLPDAQRLHPYLLDSRIFKALCRDFDTSRWARDVADRAAQNVATEVEREALYAYLTGPSPILTAPTWSYLTKRPVLRDHEGAWRAPAEIFAHTNRDIRLLEGAVSLAASRYRRNRDLAKRLHFKRKATGRDLVALANLVAEKQNEVQAANFKSAISSMPTLVTRPIANELAAIECLVAGAEFVAPETAYVRAPEIVAVVGPDGRYIDGLPRRLLERIGVRTKPLADDILNRFDDFVARDARPSELIRMYESLAVSLKEERRGVAELSSRQIAWASGTWHQVQEILIGREHASIFGDAVPVVTESRLVSALSALGAARSPTQNQWIQLIDWWDARAATEDRARLTDAEIGQLRKLYKALPSISPQAPPRARWLLDRNRGLNAIEDVRAGRLLLDDSPDLARALEREARVSLVDEADIPLRTLLESVGLRRLSEIAARVRVVADGRPGVPLWFEAHSQLLLDRVHRGSFASAVLAVLRSESLGVPSIRSLGTELARFERVVPNTTLSIAYRVSRTTVTVAAECVFEGDSILTIAPRSKSDLVDWVARGVAELLTEDRRGRAAMSDRIYRLLECRSEDEIERYLNSRGIAWTRPATSDHGPGTVEELPLLADGAKENLERSHDEAEEAAVEVASLIATRLESLQTPVDSRPTNGSSNGTIATPPSRQERSPETLEDDADVDIVLPPMASLHPVYLDTPTRPAVKKTRTALSTSPGRVRTPAQQRNDQRVGDRGEEVVFEDERRRVAARGQDPRLVQWISRDTPAANHDIKSVDETGNAIWIEVKATRGRDGTFTWPRGEFELALEMRSRYVLWRVYDAASVVPVLRAFPDPIALIYAHEMDVDVATLTATLPTIEFDLIKASPASA